VAIEPATSFFFYGAVVSNGSGVGYSPGVTVPCSTIGMANSMVFSATMKDNLSAGLRREIKDKKYCEDVLYCNEDGTLQSARCVIAKKISNTNDDIDTYPYSNSVTGNNTYASDSIIFDRTFSIDKDPGEALKFTYQVHFIENEPSIVIGESLTKKHPLITSQPNKNLQVRVLSGKIRRGEDRLLEGTISGEFDVRNETNNTFSVSLTDNVNLTGAIAWAITDENGNLYVGCNDVTKKTLYFSHVHKRK
jgi:hypothetical protein